MIFICEKKKKERKDLIKIRKKNLKSKSKNHSIFSNFSLHVSISFIFKGSVYYIILYYTVYRYSVKIFVMFVISNSLNVFS